ncbi:MAG: carbohydrate ABC transporter permease [bacterium]
MTRRSWRYVSRRIFWYVCLAIVALFWIAPIVWMLSTSLKTESEIFTLPLHWLPWTFTLEHYLKAIKGSYVMRWFFNSAFITATETILVLIVSSITAYAFARIKFAGRNVLFIVVLSTMMIPGQVTLIPTYLLLSWFGWVNTYQGVIAPGLGGAFGIFLLKQFFEGIPEELEDAAKIDGCGRLGIFLRIILPLSIPALAALGIFTTLGSWNDFLWPLIVLQETSMMTLPVGLSNLQATYATSSYGVLMAAAFVSSFPILVVYIFFQDKIIKGITITGIIKG